MPPFTRYAAALLSIMAMAQPALAQTVAAAKPARPCVTEQEVSALAIYAAPSLIQTVGTRCGKALSPGGFIATKGQAMAARFLERQVAVWPTAKSAMLKLAPKPEEAALIRQLPDDAVRPLFGPVVSQMLIKDIKPADCINIERGLRIMAPLPVESVGELAGFMMTVAKVKEPSVCPWVEPAAKAKPQ